LCIKAKTETPPAWFLILTTCYLVGRFKKMKSIFNRNLGKISLGTIVALSILFTMFFADRLNIASITARANTYYSELVSGAPLVQTWTDSTQIANDDDWTGVVSIEGFRGNGLTSVVGGSPTAVLTDTPGNDLDVTANQTDPLTSTAEGVAEFALSNPTVALKASDFASAPNVVVHLDSRLCTAGKAIRISYLIRDIDNSPIDSVQPVSLQYRIGMTGNYSNVLFTTVADATAGVGQATKTTPVFATLPQAVTGQVFDVRIITSNAAGIDEWVGIDDIRAECLAPTGASSSIQGRATVYGGRGISRARVSLTNTNTGQTVVVYTNQRGYFNIQDLPVGDVYAISIDHKRYSFPVASQSFQLLDDSQTVEFIAQ
jgi:Carboxypeptidase regulatory-like domain